GRKAEEVPKTWPGPTAKSEAVPTGGWFGGGLIWNSAGVPARAQSGPPCPRGLPADVSSNQAGRLRRQNAEVTPIAVTSRADGVPKDNYESSGNRADSSHDRPRPCSSRRQSTLE